MGKLIINHSESVFYRNREYVISVDGVDSGKLSYGNTELEMELTEGIHEVIISAGSYSVSEIISMRRWGVKTINIYPSASKAIINVLLIIVTVCVLCVLLTFLKDGDRSVQLLMFIILIPLCLVLLTSRKNSRESFLILTE
jgi:hypothetical protein